jgi:RNA polymerase sigma-70 factor (ECF subfamily)
MDPEEEQIWQSIQAQDRHVFEQYYKEHYKFFYLAAWKYLREQGPAEEAVNDVFVRLWQDAGRLDIRSSLRSYLYRAVVNRCLNELDKNKRDRRDRKEAHRGTEEAAVESKGMEDNELKLRLFQAIDRLPEQCQRVFRMSRFEELKQQEIADKLGISIKTVKNHITNALQQLHKVLEDWR